MLILCHERRNLAEYEGYLETDDQLVTDLLLAADKLLRKVETLAAAKVSTAIIIQKLGIYDLRTNLNSRLREIL